MNSYQPVYEPVNLHLPNALDPVVRWPDEFMPVSTERAARAIREGNHLEAILHGQRPERDRLLLIAIDKGWLAFAYSPDGRLRAQPTKLALSQKFN
jgi:hypothetical protein